MGLRASAAKSISFLSPCPASAFGIELQGQRPVAAEIEAPSPDRTAPVCKHFGTCGGCSLQHWAEAPYKEWKQGLVTSALQRAGIEAPIEPLRTYPVSSRRRATFTAHSAGGKIVLGYNAARTHDVNRSGGMPDPPAADRPSLAAFAGRAARGHACQERGENFHHRSSQRPRLRNSGTRIAGFRQREGHRHSRCGRIHPRDMERRACAACGGAARFIRRYRSNAAAQRLPAGRRSLRAGHGGLGSRMRFRTQSEPPAQFAISSRGLAHSPFPAAKLAPVTAYEENQSCRSRACSGSKASQGSQGSFSDPPRPLPQPAGPAGAEQVRQRHYRSAARRGRSAGARAGVLEDRHRGTCSHAIRQALPATPPS